MMISLHTEQAHSLKIKSNRLHVLCPCQNIRTTVIFTRQRPCASSHEHFDLCVQKQFSSALILAISQQKTLTDSLAGPYRYFAPTNSLYVLKVKALRQLIGTHDNISLALSPTQFVRHEIYCTFYIV